PPVPASCREPLIALGLRCLFPLADPLPHLSARACLSSAEAPDSPRQLIPHLLRSLTLTLRRFRRGALRSEASGRAGFPLGKSAALLSHLMCEERDRYEKTGDVDAIRRNFCARVRSPGARHGRGLYVPGADRRRRRQS